MWLWPATPFLPRRSCPSFLLPSLNMNQLLLAFFVARKKDENQYSSLLYVIYFTVRFWLSFVLPQWTYTKKTIHAPPQHPQTVFYFVYTLLHHLKILYTQIKLLSLFGTPQFTNLKITVLKAFTFSLNFPISTEFSTLFRPTVLSLSKEHITSQTSPCKSMFSYSFINLNQATTCVYEGWPLVPSLILWSRASRFSSLKREWVGWKRRYRER